MIPGIVIRVAVSSSFSLFQLTRAGPCSAHFFKVTITDAEFTIHLILPDLIAFVLGHHNKLGRRWSLSTLPLLFVVHRPDTPCLRTL